MIEPPLIVQADGAVLLETQHPEYEVARERLASFAELEKSPEYVHFYRITPISIWNAAALGEQADQVVPWIEANARFPVAKKVTERIYEWFRRGESLGSYSHLWIHRQDENGCSLERKL